MMGVLRPDMAIKPRLGKWTCRYEWRLDIYHLKISKNKKIFWMKCNLINDWKAKNILYYIFV